MAMPPSRQDDLKVPFDPKHSFFSVPGSIVTVNAPNTASETPLPPLPPLPVLPAVAVRHSELSRFIQDDKGPEKFVSADLDVSRLNLLHKHLWLAGQQRAARPLHRQVLSGRTILPTEQADLHLLWMDGRLFIKPCPDNATSWGTAVGLLISYTQLVRRQSDLSIAHSEGILPEAVTWERWIALTRAVYEKAPLGDFGLINPRFSYGELRLARINWIHRVCSKTTSVHDFAWGYFNGNPDYTSFFQRNIHIITATTVYIVVVLTAMQVGLATDRLQDSVMFQNAAYGFTIFAIIGSVGSLAVLVFVVMGYLFFINLFDTLKKRKQVTSQHPGEWENVALTDLRSKH
ncbi:hypothetical protein N0V84_004699 [Fusarium piperis]|uniref:Uncharacterized protein n=1 Tax=Fusarium piperis TaxID=1435070 RepID=A0A9W9BR93_9HYPO|nr:hypothetical protein N0V84_004699 [Fusarium piperis]